MRRHPAVQPQALRDRENSPPKLGPPIPMTVVANQFERKLHKSRPESAAIVITTATSFPREDHDKQHDQQPGSAPVTYASMREGSPLKMRVQSPKKLRERLNGREHALLATSKNLQDEIDHIGVRLATLKAPGPVSQSTSTDGPALSNRLEHLSNQLQIYDENRKSAYDDLRRDFDKTLALADKRARKLEELYKEANAENEALYERFNKELGKVLARVRAGQGVEEIWGRLAEALTEIGNLKSDKARLKREVAELQSRVLE